MPAPLTQSVFKKVDFNSFLDELGFVNQSQAKRIQFLDKILQALDYQIVTKILSRLQDKDKLALVDLMKQANEDGNEKPVNDFLLERLPDVEALVDEAIEKIKSDLRFQTLGMKELMDEHIALVMDKKNGVNTTLKDKAEAAETRMRLNQGGDVAGTAPKADEGGVSAASGNSSEPILNPFPWEVPAGSSESTKTMIGQINPETFDDDADSVSQRRVSPFAVKSKVALAAPEPDTAVTDTNAQGSASLSATPDSTDTEPVTASSRTPILPDIEPDERGLEPDNSSQALGDELSSLQNG